MIPSSAATYIVVRPPTHHDQNHVSRRYHQSLGRGRLVYNLPHPEVPAFPNGTSADAILFALGHPGQSLSPTTTLSPEMYRSIRHFAYESRQGKTAHIIASADAHSPYGNQRLIEAIARNLALSQAEVLLHLGVWHATPKEVISLCREIQNLHTSSLKLASVFDINHVNTSAGSQKYIDGILHPQSSSHPYDKLLTEGYTIMADYEPAPENIFLIANHALHGLDGLEEGIRRNGGEVTHLPQTHPLDPAWQSQLNRQKHIFAITTKQKYIEAFFGTQVNHPYFEQIHIHSPHEALEMLISPHFGYSYEPYRTVVLLDDDGSDSFDWLLDSYLRQRHAYPYYCCFLQPHTLSGNLLVSNLRLDTKLPLYEQLPHDLS